MAYIEVHQALLTHKKTLRLARLLGMDRFAVAGRLLALWHWALDNAPDGEIAFGDSDLLADVMGWEGAPDDLCQALLAAGFLETQDNQYLIHDWWDYAGNLIEKRKENAERMRAARAAKKAARAANVHDVCDARAANVQGLTYPTVAVADPTVPNQSISNRREPSAVVAAATRTHAREADVAPEPTSGDDGGDTASPDDEKPEFAQSYPSRGALALVPSQPVPAPQKQPPPETVPRTATDAQLAALEPLARQVAAAANLKPGYNLVALTRVLWTYRARDGDELVKEADKLAERRARGHSPPLTIGELDNWLARWAKRLDENTSQASNEHETTTNGGNHANTTTGRRYGAKRATATTASAAERDEELRREIAERERNEGPDPVGEWQANLARLAEEQAAHSRDGERSLPRATAAAAALRQVP